MADAVNDAVDLPGRADVLAAAERIRDRTLLTPTLSRRSLNDTVGFALYLKCENQQRTGSFKFRGASNAVARLVENERPAAVATHSSGNHGAALALAASQAGIDAEIVVPRGASPFKRAAIERYGGRVVDCGETLAEREATLADVVRSSGAVYIPPYDHADIIAGQGSAALELLAAVPALHEIWVPVGGGGLASGTLLAMSDSGVRVHGVEPELADDAYWSMKKGSIQPQRPPRSVADGLRTALGVRPFELFKAHDFQISTVTEAEIVSAQRLLWERLKLVVEPSGAVPLAGLLKVAAREPGAFRGRKVGVILSGGNTAFPLV